jgi:glycosyltransferase involved in cell wall biosynthesis
MLDAVLMSMICVTVGDSSCARERARYGVAPVSVDDGDRRMPRPTVVIPTYNRRARLERVLQALSVQDFAGEFETVVVSDGSDDGTDEYLRSDRVPLPLVACRQANAGPASARNAGVREATGDLIVFLDDDVVPTSALVRVHVETHARLGDRVVVIGPMLDPPDHEMSIWVRYEQAMLAKQYDAMMRGDWAATARQFFTGNASLRREHIVAAGGFNTALRRAEDVELALRLDAMGLSFAFTRAAAGLHYAERSFASWRNTAHSYGRSDVEFSSLPGQADRLTFLMGEFDERKFAIRTVVRAAAGRPRIERATELLLKRMAELADRFGLARSTSVILSGIYNLAYYTGFMDGLCGRAEFWRIRRQKSRERHGGRQLTSPE